MTHAESVAAAEREVVERAVAWASPTRGVWADDVHAAVDALLALRAATCQTCGGTGGEQKHTIGEQGADSRFGPPEIWEWVPCPSGCERGKRRTT